MVINLLPEPSNTNAICKWSLRGLPACGRQEATKQSRFYGVRLPRSHWSIAMTL